ncbi:hypothetical protein HY214_00770 [Candidatus Roizmanbacteria bacterium]|nr:hypothetical protein [Candidatus Roizmanbacteria bacterium]
MNDQIICPHCKNTIPLTQALTHKLQEQYQKEFKDEREKLILLYQRRLKEESAKITIATEEKLRLKIKKDLEFQMKDNENAKEELEKANKILQEQLLETSKLMRQLKQDNEQKKLELEKRLAEGEEHIRQEEKKRLNEEYRLKILEKDKKLQGCSRRRPVTDWKNPARPKLRFDRLGV